MEREIAFIFPLSEQREDRLRVKAIVRKGEIIRFIVQYEAFIAGKWNAIVRYDTAHGFAHKDLIHYKNYEEKQPLLFNDFKIAFTFAIQDLKTSWKWYRIA